MAHSKRLRKTLSAWTPIHDTTLNQSLYQERKALIFHWFDMWTYNQRVDFLECVVFDVCPSDLVKLIHSWTCKTVPKERVDFTTILPRTLSLKIFGYLDPQTLCRTSQVSWCWRFITEQDILWKPKCLQHKWYLPYSAGDKEYGGWKQHFITMVHTLDIYLPKLNITQAISTLSKSSTLLKKELKISSKNKLSPKRKNIITLKPTISAVSTFLQPQWIVPSKRPKDLEIGWKEICENSVCYISPSKKMQKRMSDFSGLVSTEMATEISRGLINPSAINSDEFLNWKKSKRHQRSHTDPTTVRTLKSLVMAKAPDHKISALNLDRGIHTLSEATKFCEEYDVKISNREKLPSSVLTEVLLRGTLPDSQKKTPIPERLNLLLLGYPNMSHPRVMIISSAIPAFEVLQEAVIPGVLQLSYNSKCFTMESVLYHLNHLLCGRPARSIGLFIEEENGALKFSEDFFVSALSLKEDKNVNTFIKSLSSYLTSSLHHGHLDIFAPLTTSEAGLETLSLLRDELALPVTVPLVSCMNNYSDYGKCEWINCPEQPLLPPLMYFDETKYFAWSFNTELSEEAMKCIKELCSKYFSQQQFNHIQKLAGRILYEALGLNKFRKIKTVFSIMVGAIECYVKQTDSDNPLLFIGKYLLNQVDSDSHAKEDNKTSEVTTSQSINLLSQQEAHFARLKSFYPVSALQDSVTIMGMCDRRTRIVKEMLSSEKAYMNLLSIIQTIYAVPLRLAIINNSPIILSTDHNLIFADADILLHASRNFIKDLNDRLKNWTVEQAFTDLLEKNIIKKLYLFWNYIHNYPVMIATVNKCLQHNLSFGAYLLRHDRRPATNMTTLMALLKCPIQQIQKYIQLLQALIIFTPTDHSDKANIIKFVEQLELLSSEVKQQEERANNVRELHIVQRNLINCPLLIEGHRKLITEITVKEMKLIIPEEWIFGNCGELHLLLFTDALIIARKTSRMIPYLLLSIDQTEFETAINLASLTVKELDASLGLKNYFVLVHKAKQWTCQLEPLTVKNEFIETLIQTMAKHKR